MSSPRETLRIAHTARCKLNMAANAPDRNFRLILGHALTLDKMILRIAEIETDSSDDAAADDEEGVANDEPHGPATATRERRVSFSSSSRARHEVSSAAQDHDRKQRRSPPPAHLPHPGEDDDDDDDNADDDDDAEPDDETSDALSLQRFPSASAQPPRLIEDEGYDEDDSDEPVTPTDDDLRAVTGGESDEELTKAYAHLAGCSCHGQSAPRASQVWEMPQKEGGDGRRLAVVRVVT